MPFSRNNNFLHPHTHPQCQQFYCQKIDISVCLKISIKNIMSLEELGQCLKELGQCLEQLGQCFEALGQCLRN